MVVYPYRGLYGLGCLYELLMTLGVIAVFIIAVRLASWCARGLAAVKPTSPVRHRRAKARFASASGLCAATWRISGFCHRPIVHGVAVRLVGLMFSNCALMLIYFCTKTAVSPAVPRFFLDMCCEMCAVFL